MSITSETVEQHPLPDRKIPKEPFDVKGGGTRDSARQFTSQ